MMEPTFRGQHKKPRLDIGQKDDVWGADEDFPDEVLVQVDLAATQAYSQVNVTKKLKSDGKFQRHHSWTGASNDEDSQTSSNVPKWHSFQIHNIENISNEVAGTKPKSTQSFFPNKSVKCQPTYQCNQLISQSCVQELERQKHEVISLKKTKDAQEGQIKTLQEILAQKNLEIQTVQQEKDNFRNRWLDEQREKRLHVEEIEKLKTELEFKKQEVESGKWINVQHHVRHNSKLTSNQFVSSQRKKQTTKSPNINDITNPFPNPETFSQSLDVSKLDNLKKAAENFKLNMCKSAEVALSSSKEVELWMLQLTRPLGIESNQGLVQILLQETIEYWNPSVLSTLNISNKNESSPSGHKMEVEVSHTHKELPTKSSTLTVAAQYIQDLCAKFSAGLNSLLDLEDNVDVHCGTTCAKPIIENSSPKKYLGLKTDCCDELLPFLEKAVCCQWWSESSSLKLDNALANTSISNSAKNGSLVDLSTDPKLTLPIYDSECCQHVASLSMLIGLKVLKQVVCYSAKVCHYLISSMCSNVTLTAPGPSNIEDHIDISYETPPTSASYNIIQRLFSLCGSHSHDIDNPVFAKLLLISLEIFECIATSSEIKDLKGFVPLFNSVTVKTCTSLKHDGTVLLAFVSLLGILCSSPTIVKASCDQEDFCLWIPLAESWQKAKDVLPKSQMLQLDRGMIKLLSRCLVRMTVRPPFLAAEECHCPFEIIPSFILYLYNQQLDYDKDNNVLDIPTLHSGVSLLYHIAHKDVHFHDHKQIVNDELISFLYWLPAIHKLHNLGQAADALFEMWAIGSDSSDECNEAC